MKRRRAGGTITVVIAIAVNLGSGLVLAPFGLNALEAATPVRNAAQAGTAPSDAAPSPAAPGPAAPSDAAADTLSEAVQARWLHDERFRRLAAELRCLVCQNQTLLDSNAPLAVDLRREVIRLMNSGQDDAAIRRHLVERYGDFVLYRPPLSLRSAVLWLGPFVLLAVALLVWWRLARRRQATPSADAGEALRRVDQILQRRQP